MCIMENLLLKIRGLPEHTRIDVKILFGHTRPVMGTCDPAKSGRV